MTLYLALLRDEKYICKRYLHTPIAWCYRTLLCQTGAPYMQSLATRIGSILNPDSEFRSGDSIDPVDRSYFMRHENGIIDTSSPRMSVARAASVEWTKILSFEVRKIVERCLDDDLRVSGNHISIVLQSIMVPWMRLREVRRSGGDEVSAAFYGFLAKSMSWIDICVTSIKASKNIELLDLCVDVCIMAASLLSCCQNSEGLSDELIVSSAIGITAVLGLFDVARDSMAPTGAESVDDASASSSPIHFTGACVSGDIDAMSFMGLSLVERYIILSSNLPMMRLPKGEDPKCFSVHPDTCTRVLGWGLLSSVHSVRMRATNQLPALIANYFYDKRVLAPFQVRSSRSQPADVLRIKGFVLKLGHSIGRHASKRMWLHTIRALYRIMNTMVPCSIADDSSIKCAFCELKMTFTLWMPLFDALKRASSLPVAAYLDLVRACGVVLCKSDLYPLDEDEDARKTFGAHLRKYLGLLRDSEESIRNCVIQTLPSLIRGYGSRYRDGYMPSLPMPAEGRLLALRSAFGGKSDAGTIGAFLRHLYTMVSLSVTERINAQNSMQESLVLAIACLGASADVDASANLGKILLQWSLLKLSEVWCICTHRLLSGSSTTRDKINSTLTKEQLVRIATSHGFEMSSKFTAVRQLFESVREGLYPELIAMLLSARFKDSPIFRYFLGEIMGCADKLGTPEKFIEAALPVLLPDLLRDMNMDVLAALARHLYPSASTATDEQVVRKLIIDNHRSWIVELVMMLTKKDNQKEGIGVNKGYEAWKRILRVVRFTMKDILQLGRKQVLEYLVMRLVDRDGNPSKVAENALDLLARYRGNGKVAPAIDLASSVRTKETKDSQVPIASLVRSEFMFMMGVLSECIQKNSNDLGKRNHALLCTNKLLLLAESELRIFMPKVLPTLKSALLEPPLQKNAVKALFTMLKRVPLSVLADNLGTIFVALLPCFDDDESCAVHAAVETLEWMIVSNRATFHPNFKDIPFVPGHPLLHNISKVLGEELAGMEYYDKLDRLTNLIRHDSQRVCLLALEELHAFLIADNRKTVRKIHAALLEASQNSSLLPHNQRKNQKPGIVKGGKPKTTKPSISDVVSRLLGSLLRLARKVGGTSQELSNVVEKMQVACANCCGELGAIDPGLLNLERLQGAMCMQLGLNAPGSSTSFELGNCELASHLIEAHLVKALWAAPDPYSHMQVGFAIQELLRFLLKAGTRDTLDGMEQKLKAHFADNSTSLAVRPFLSTNYDNRSWFSPSPKGRNGKAFFGPGVQATISIGDWVAHMTHKSTGPQKAVFDAVRVMRASRGTVDMLLFLLPYLVQNLVCCQNELAAAENAASIRAEILGILLDTWASADDRSSNSTWTKADLEMSAQCVFGLLDTLISWESQAQKTARAMTNSVTQEKAKC